MEISEKLSGFLLVNKPHGWTSFDCVKLIRGILERGLRERGFTLKRLKVGHSGTLDPFATGLLLIGIGKGTSAMSQFSDFNKTYIADIGFGIKSPTFDLDSPDLSVDYESLQKAFYSDVTDFNPDCIEHYDFPWDKIAPALNSFVVVQQQLPPQFSALKVNGKRAYELARKGIEVKLKTREITVFPTDDDGGIDYVTDEIQNIHIGGDIYKIPVLVGVMYAVSKGTYIRSLVRDLGEKLGVPTALVGLERISIYAPYLREEEVAKKGELFKIDDAFSFTKETKFEEIIDAMIELSSLDHTKELK